MRKLTEYLCIAAAVDSFGEAQNTIRKWAARGDIPMHRHTGERISPIQTK